MATRGQIMKALEIKGNRESLQVLQKKQDEDNLKKSATQQKIKEKKIVWRTKRNWMGQKRKEVIKTQAFCFWKTSFKNKKQVQEQDCPVLIQRTESYNVEATLILKALVQNREAFRIRGVEMFIVPSV